MLGPGVRSDLIRLYLWEGNLDLAWREAKARPCGSDLLLELAQLREKDHPADAIHVYMTFVEPLIEKKNNHSYTEALSYLTRIGVLKVRMGLMADFRAYLDSLREKHPTKKSFLKMLDGSGLGR